MDKKNRIEEITARKIVTSLEELALAVQDYKTRNITTVFTNGCFDLLHAGHVRCLMDAKNYADKLIVAINSDEYIKEVKGAPLPIYPEKDRVDMISALGCVDLVFVFSEKTVDNILLTIKPDFHAKGTDYTKYNLPESETVRSYGGQIAIVGGPKTYSTREMIRKIQSLEVNQKI